jgi:hypothetical protein
MNVSRRTLWLTLIIVVLVLVASIAGLALTSTYARETAPYANQAKGQDIANLISIVVLVIAIYFMNQRSFKAFLIWIGTLLTLLYAYVIYAFAAHFNSLFLVYVAIAGLCFYAFFSSILELQPERLQSHFVAVTRYRAVSIFLLLVAILFALLWLSQDVPSIVAGKVPQSVTEIGLLTNPVHVLDLGFYLPGMVITAILLWRKQFLGFFFAIPFLVFSILTSIGILAIDVVGVMQGSTAALGVDLFIAAIIIVSLVLSVIYVREIKQ